MDGVARPLALHVFPEFAYGGQQTRLAAIASAPDDPFRHAVVSLGDDISARAIMPDGVDVRRVALRKTAGVSSANLRALTAAFRAVEADLLCTYNWGALEAVAANALGPRLAHVHYEDGFGPDETLTRQKRRRVLMRRVLLARARVVVPSTGLARVAAEVWRLPRRRVIHLPNGIDLARFAAPERGARDGPVLIGAVGALRPEKNLRLLIDAVATLDNARLEIVGDGPARAALEAAAAPLGDRVVFSGRTAAPEAAYRRFDVFAMSSDTEQMPLGLMEAMAAGLPTAATRVGDIDAMVADAACDFLVEPGDRDGLAEALRRLTDDAALRRRVGAANRDKAHRDFALTRMVARHRTVMAAALDGRS
ncbi:MAG: glycosyltransferase family 4 protein [Pseudomonadota bacterium]